MEGRGPGQGKATKDRRSVRVVVVGAGMAGLSTVRHLLQAGFRNVTLLEASDRIGGRIKSVKVADGVVVELGATCIHGASPQNPVYALAQEFGLVPSLVHLDRIAGQYHQEDGRVIDKGLVKRVWELYMGLEDEMTEAAADPKKVETALKKPTNLAQYMREARPRVLQCFAPGPERQAADRALNSMCCYLAFMCGDSLDKVSADLVGQYKTLPGPEMMYTGSGYSGLVAKILESIPADIIHLNREVSTIRWSPEAEEERAEAEVTCRSGHIYTADHVVVTCSLGYLKANHLSMFHPPIPARKAQAIQRRGFGPVAKLFLYYNRPVRQDGVKLAWSTHGEPMTSEPGAWMKDFTWLDMNPTNSMTIGGPFAGKGVEVMESMPEEKVAAQAVHTLRKFLKDPDFPEPTKILRSSWNSDPLFRGGYSYPSVDSQPDDAQELAAPLPSAQQPRLLFAGEATHPDFYSTVHGAFLSGQRESQRLVDLYPQGRL